MASVQQQLENLALSAAEVKGLTNWPDAMVEDYINIIRNLIIIASSTDVNVDQIDQNTQDIATNAAAIAQNAADIATNAAAIAVNAGNITSLQNDKADKISGGTTDAIVIQNASGNIADSAVKIGDLVPVIGTGNPNGVVTSNYSLLFVDSTLAAETLYFNTQVGVNTGWIPV